IGEGKEADLGIAGGQGVGIFFENGEVVKKIPSGDLEELLIAQVEKKVEMMRAAGLTSLRTEDGHRVDLPMASGRALSAENL
ncbi:MAG: hypothetical protein M0Z25_10775, partial [Nitrospiraceae bacterium]|nr:hypothetical protein [Nitrospiraceae bacterium]